MTEDHVTPEPPSTREQAQIELILAAFRDEVEIWPPNWRQQGVESLYRRGSLLTRDRDLPRVRELFDGGTVASGGVNGLTRFTPPAGFVFPDDAPVAETLTLRYLAYVDSVSPCPATEPEEVPPGSPPYPIVSAEGCDGRGIKVVIGDVGWTGNPPAYWLEGVDGDDERPFDPPNSDHIRPYAGHGRFIAGVLRGVARHAEVVVRKCFDRAGAEFESELVSRLDRLLDDSPDIISLSAGTNTRDDLPSLAFEVFVEERLSRVKGECTEPPDQGQVRRFDGMARWSGTSFATPLVAGLIAARTSRTGESARQAADALLSYARRQAIPGVGPVLMPGDACASPDDRNDHCGRHRCC
jgi:hypothetical protein